MSPPEPGAKARSHFADGMMSRFFFAAVVAALIAVAIWALRSPEREERRVEAKLMAKLQEAVAGQSGGSTTPAEANATDRAATTKQAPPSTTSVVSPVPTSEAAAQVDAPAESPILLAEPLNSPKGTIGADLDTLRIILEAWRSNFPREGNPVGENAEITAALTGRNPLKIALIPKNHPAIDVDGQLCDRWGTPFHFHQISGDRMELRSAGPDRQFGTADDALLAPP